MNNIVLQIAGYTYVEITAIVIIMMVVIAFILFLSYHSRKTPILQVFGSQYFRFGIVNPAGQLSWHNRLTKDFKVVGKVILWKYKDQNYKLQEDRIFWDNKIPSSMYKFGNPLALDILGIPDAEIDVWDERTKSYVKRRMSSQELKGAIESKVVNELNKVGFNKMETVVLIVMVVAIGFNIVALYQIYQINTAMSTLIDQLNTILKNYVPKTPVATILSLWLPFYSQLQKNRFYLSSPHRGLGKKNSKSSNRSHALFVKPSHGGLNRAWEGNSPKIDFSVIQYDFRSRKNKPVVRMYRYGYDI